MGMTIRDKIAELQAEIARLEPLSLEEERRQATRLALIGERRGAEMRRSLGGRWPGRNRWGSRSRHSRT